MSKTEEAITPARFVQLFRQHRPRFASRDQRSGGYEQQDADEFLVELLNIMKQDKLGDGAMVDNLFSGEFETTETCKDNKDEEPTKGVEMFNKLTCFLDRTVSHLVSGLKKGLVTEREKNSASLGVNAVYEKTLEISSLPEYLNIQISRFQWKETSEGGVNCKILRKVVYPFTLDVTNLCNKKLRDSINKYRKVKLDWEDEQREKKQSSGIANLDKLKEEDKKKKERKTKFDKKEEIKKENDDKMDVEEEKDKKEADTTKMDIVETVDEKLKEKKEVFTESGEYELIAVVTHKGRSASSGHYIGYAKDGDRWVKFDDDNAIGVTKEEIQTLYGGGDFQMGYLCFYKKIPVVKME